MRTFPEDSIVYTIRANSFPHFITDLTSRGVRTGEDILVLSVYGSILGIGVC